MDEMDFGFDGKKDSVEEPVKDKPNDDVVDIDSGEEVDPITGKPITDINKPDDKDKNDDTKVDDKPDNKGEKPADKEEKDVVLEEGTIIEYGDKKYTVDKDGNIVDEKGEIYKSADKATKWIKSLQTEETETDPAVVDIKAVQKAIGVEITDADGKTIEFENTAEGVASYVNAYVESTKQQIAEATIESLYAKYPILENVINYYVANGNSLEGFNELRDRSTITLDVNNEAQCEAIIRESWKENARGGNVETYIQYLKSQNLLGSTAEEELQAMVAKDKAAADELANKAAETERQEIERQKAYWNDIQKRVMTDKRIGKYQIPDTIIRTHNGQKVSATSQDFYNYIYQVDKYGRSQYENDLIKEAKENPEARVVDDLIAAYLKFTGGSYESLVNMAINEQKVKTIKIMSKQGTKPKSVRVTTPGKSKEIDLGY